MKKAYLPSTDLDFRSLATLLVSGGLFTAVAWAVSADWLTGFDTWLLLSLRNAADPADPLGPAWLERAIRDLTALGGNPVLTLVTLGSVGWLWVQRKTPEAGWLLLSIVAGVSLSYLLKAGFARPRPEIVTQGQMVYTASFPSGHAMNTAVVYLSIGLIAAHGQCSRATRTLALGLPALLSLAVGCSRVYLGVHWPSDVIAGWSVGLAWVSVCWLAAGTFWTRMLGGEE